MLTLVLLLTLAWAFYIGYRRGLILQVYYGFAALVALWFSGLYYQQLAATLSLWVPYASATQNASTYFFESSLLFSLDKVFYAGLAYLILYTLAYSVLRFLGIFLHLIKVDLPWSDSYTRLGAGAMSVLVTWLSLQMGLTILATLPLDMVQNQLHQSLLANIMIRHTPIMTGFLHQIWLTNIVG